MRLGKEEAMGVIEEPIEVSTSQHDSAVTDPRPEPEIVAKVQRKPRSAPEDQPASAS